MKLVISPEVNPVLVLRRSGYGLTTNRRTGERSFVRHLGAGSYPRFHAYLSSQEINLHLDQKQPSYRGARAHNGEYDSELVTEEIIRIQDISESLKFGDQSENVTDQPTKHRGFWSRFF